MHYFLRILLLVLIATGLQAQQNPQYTQFMFNKLYFNPAYAGSKRVSSLSLLYRQQWAGMDGAPRTQTFNFHAPLLKERLGLGLSVTNDAIGLTNMWNVEGSYSYRIPVNEDAFFSAGLRTSIRSIQMRWDQADPTQLLDNTIPGAESSKIVPNFGFGLYYDNPNFYVGFSIPHLINSNIDFTEGTATASIEPRLERHYYLMGGLILDLTPNIKFKPAAMIKAVARSPLDLDVNASFLFYEKFWAGLTFRLGESIDGVIQYVFSKRFRLGLAYDFPTNRLRQFNQGSFEVFVEYNFVMRQDLKLHNPRFF